MTPYTRHKKETSTDTCLTKPKPISMTAPPCSSIAKVSFALPPPPSSKEITKPLTLKDAGVDEVLGKKVNSNEKVTQYTTTVSSSFNTLENNTPIVKTRCTNHMEHEGKYISNKIKGTDSNQKI